MIWYTSKSTESWDSHHTVCITGLAEQSILSLAAKNTSEIYVLTVLQARSPQSRCWQAGSFSRTQKNPFPGSPLAWGFCQRTVVHLSSQCLTPGFMSVIKWTAFPPNVLLILSFYFSISSFLMAHKSLG